ncbi:histidine-rich glycoprotein isoform X2 [Tympanuchus pallidicinctus]|uniref:histidine-rich glycoprotein isoform X2 n=1 Tax=Tympanuchus pallidicinctus TaxID=109042 RepID=UPI0022872479|nr:histidine-rich glycoprotein isoform X2 [Tympanuchus pallidicinctus]
MLRVTSALFLALLHCCNAQTKTSQVAAPTDCEAIETDAGMALDLVNRHRQDGYVFGLFRVADAHRLHTENSSVLYLTLDVLETECSVLSGRPWETCEYGDLYSMDFGQCKIITYTSSMLKKPKLYGYNCTLSPVPPDLIECKDCPVKVEVLEVTEEHKDLAAKLLEKFNREGNHTNYFKVNKVEKILKATASREAHILGFSIKETKCSRGEQQQADEPLECEFLDDWHAHTGFCKARTVSDPEEPNGIEINCELYRPWQRYYGQRCRSPAPGWPHKHPHHHRHRHRHRGPPTFQFKPEDSEHNHDFNKDHQGNHKEPPPPCHGRHHHPPPPHHGLAPSQEEPEHPSSTPPLYDKQHSPPLIQEKSDFRPFTPPPYDEQNSPPPPPHHGPHCPPPHGHHHSRRPPHHGPHCPPPHGHHHPHHPPHHGPRCPPPHRHHHPPPPPQEEPENPSSGPLIQEKSDFPPSTPPYDEEHNPPPPPHHGPHCPPPHGHHHPPPPPHHGPHCPPPHGHHHPPPPPQEEPENPYSPPLIQEKSDFRPFTPPPYDEQNSPPPPPHHGPHYPPPHGHHHPHHPPHHGPHCPPPHGHHHPHHPPHHGPHCPPPHGHHHPHHPPHHGPHCPPPPPPPPGHHPYLYHHYHKHHCNKTRTSGSYFPFQVTGSVYRIPVLNMQDSLTPPSAKFPELSLLGPQSAGTDEDTPFTDSSLREMPEAPHFPDHPSQSKSCPGKPKLDLPKILPLLPHKSMAESLE